MTRWAILAGAAGLLGGCFFDQLQASDEHDIQRVEQKQAALQAEQARSATLNQQEAELLDELGEQELSLNQLNDRVQRINADNGRAIADNDASRLQYERLLAGVHETNAQLAAVRRDASDALEVRRERISSLKAQLKAQLDLLLR